MAITGHTTEKSFITFIKKPQRDFAERLEDYYFEKDAGERQIAQFLSTKPQHSQ